jgi:copper chaperone CopZ
MKKVLSLSLVLILFACSDASSTEKKAKSSQKQEVAISNETMVVEVEGMVCAMGCGGSIRKELKNTGAVSRVEVDFVEGNKTQTLKISFDNNLISQSTIISKIEKLNKGQFSVNVIGSTAIETRSVKTEEKSKVNVAESNFELPNLLEILSSLVIQ